MNLVAICQLHLKHQDRGNQCPETQIQSARPRKDAVLDAAQESNADAKAAELEFDLPRQSGPSASENST